MLIASHDQRAMKAQASLCICANSPEPSLLTNIRPTLLFMGNPTLPKFTGETWIIFQVFWKKYNFIHFMHFESVLGWLLISLIFIQNSKQVKTDQMHFVASDLGLYCLHMSQKNDARLLPMC